jgi:hypothetical protein
MYRVNLVITVFWVPDVCKRQPPVGEVSANFLQIEGCNLSFLDRSRYFSIK